MSDITKIIERIKTGEQGATEKLLATVYEELRWIAQSQMSKENPGHTLQTTALIHEAYIRMFGSDVDTDWENRRHFFASAAEAMRRILVDYARKKKAIKRGAGAVKSEYVGQLEAVQIDFDEALDIHQALDELEKSYPEYAQVVKFRYFAGLTIRQTAELMEISIPTANRHWSFARAWLHDRVGSKQ